MEEKAPKTEEKIDTKEFKQEEKKVLTSINEEKSQKILRLTQISLLLDEYDDIFSDFDPSPYGQRALSDDFLSETKKASKDKVSGGIELRFLMPAHLRKPSLESVIRKRIREHFKKNLEGLNKERSDMIKKGAYFVLMGVVFMFFATLIMYKFPQNNMFTSFLIVLLEPAGWFLTWSGLDYIIFRPETIKSNLEFNHKMSNAEITFLSY